MVSHHTELREIYLDHLIKLSLYMSLSKSIEHSKCFYVFEDVRHIVRCENGWYFHTLIGL